MTRQLKFRASNTRKCGSDGRDYSLVYFDLVELDRDYIISSGTYIDDDTVVEQFTGMTDNEEHCIFEGDIVKVTTIEDEEFISTVVWNDCSCLFGFVVQDGQTVKSLDGSMDIKVIGNIHQDQDLLTKDL